MKQRGTKESCGPGVGATKELTESQNYRTISRPKTAKEGVSFQWHKVVNFQWQTTP